MSSYPVSGPDSGSTSILSPGTIIADRFEIERIAGSGGMGTVYQALDRYSGERVALKVLNQPSGRSIEARRFVREGHILATLRHPGIVSYVDSGQLPSGSGYLVMEWLVGEDLAHRLERGSMTVAECVELLKQVAAGLACAHQLDIVHRDIKPSNLFLCEQGSRVVLLDFGIAHYDREGTITALTMAGSVVGTLNYMAPEQAAGDAKITPAADIYALGRVAYRCLAARKARPVAHVAAALARVMFEEDPPLSQICPWVPEPLAILISRMMSKEPSRRPQSAMALLDELALLGPLHSDVPVAAPREISGETREEQGLYSIVLAVPTTATSASGSAPSGALPLSAADERPSLDETLIRHRAQPCWLLDGSLLLTMQPSESAHDQAAHAARCALLIKAAWPRSVVALATGRGHISKHTLVGEVVDRAARLIKEQDIAEHASPQVAAAKARGVWVDGLSASLLERRFALIPVLGRAMLTGEAVSSEDARPVLGTLPPCMGREQELTILDAIVSRCTSDSVSQAVLATAPPGQGKTRLRQEFLLRLRRRSRPSMVLLGVGELLSGGVPFGVIGSALRRYFDIASTASPEADRKQLVAATQNLLGQAASLRVAPCLGELCGLRFPDEESPELRAARNDPQILNKHILHALTQLFDALCKRSPVVLLLDDLQWGDLLTVGLIDALLREFESRPLMVLALARPEVKDTFPKIRQWPRITELPLGGLSRGASENIIRFVLGNRIPASVVSKLAQQAAGNALLLEELIRAQSDNQSTALPETVLAILQVRMQRLPVKMRLLLSKASVFGLHFWRGGIQAIQDSVHSQGGDLEADLRLLSQAEFITQHRTSSIPGDTEYSFRHVLMREAAYGLLRDDQKQRWHRAVGHYLERAGGQDSLLLAEHFSRSDEPQHSIAYFARAASLALEADDHSLLRSCIRRAEDAMIGGSCEPELRGELLAITAIAQYRTGDLDGCIGTGREALLLLPPGGSRWARLMYSLLSGSMMMGRVEIFGELARRFMATDPLPGTQGLYLETGGVLLTNLSLFGQRELGEELVARMAGLGAETVELQPSVRAWFRFGQNRMSSLIHCDPWVSWRHAQGAFDAVMQTGNPRWISIMGLEAALAEKALGSPHWESTLRTAIDVLRSIKVEVSPGYTSVGAAAALAESPEHAAEAVELAEGALSRNSDNAYFAGMAQLALARVQAAAGEPVAAEVAARQALLLFGTMPPLRTAAAAVLCRALLAQGRTEVARQAAASALAQLRALGDVAHGDLSLRLAAMDVFDAAGAQSQADAQLALALSVLQERAGRIPDPDWRRSYLENVPENVRILALGRKRLGDSLTEL